MRLLALGLSLLLFLPVTTAAPTRPGGNLLVNGSFEEGPDDIGEYKSLDKDATEIKGWKVTRGQIDLIGTFFVSAHGSRCIDLHGSPGYGGGGQTFKTRKGAKYKVELQLAATPEAGERGIWVGAAGDKKKFEVDSGDGSKEKLKWEKVTWEFTATGDETTLEIYTTEKGDNFRGPIIDEVSVTATRARARHAERDGHTGAETSSAARRQVSTSVSQIGTAGQSWANRRRMYLAPEKPSSIPSVRRTPSRSWRTFQSASSNRVVWA